ncbi:LOW QUALITY PROTEIN: aspartate aminotransferase [Geomicrobium sp. JCM 19038]|nr:LOW QUALITY PROTEIN: aspartate aminotransferase [Geomicrobium sp. JCM 19038]
MKYAFAKRVRHLQSSAVRDILKVVNQGNVLSFAGGLPDDELFPVEAIEDSFRRALSKGKKAMQYGETEGYYPLREVIIERMKKKQISEFTPNHVLLTTGSQQAIDLFSRVMIGPGDVIFTEEPTYLAALQVFQSYEAKIVPIRCDEFGMDFEDLQEKVKAYRPKVVYVVPTFSNPTGRVWSFERREALVRLAHRQNFVIFEDDPYGDIQYTPGAYTPMAALDDGTHVVYTSTFSKTAVPALRTGWIVGPYQIIRMMSQAKQANDLHSNSLAHQALYELCMNFDLDEHIKTISKLYGHRKDVMVDSLRSSGLETMSFVEPEGGMFLWLEVDPQINTEELLQEAVSRGIAYVPGAPFYAGTPQYNTLRLNYTHATDDDIRFGMKTMTELFKEVEQKQTDKVSLS